MANRPSMSAMPHETRQGALPTGTVTFAFTDIEGSTARWERYPNEMELAVRRHDELMRSAFRGHGGHIFKTVGDAFCVAFWRPADAVAAILDAQRALASEDFSTIDGLRVRAAVHVGTADERDADYFGPAVNRVARLLAIGHGGQVLISGVATDLVQGALPAQATLRDLGQHRLRDLARPEHVYQLLAPGLVSDFPPLHSLDVLPNNLPLQLKSFVGREKEVAEIAALIAAHRLVTLVGSGGIGKTRTSLQVAANLLDGSGDGVWLIELAPLSSRDYIPSSIAQTFGITLPREGDDVENLARALMSKRALLVFDNCEHLVEPAARIISAILRGCPKIKVLASSRQALGIEGEETYRMPSLDVPLAADRFDASQAIRSAAIALFVERALSADKTFTLTDENVPIVADICCRSTAFPLRLNLRRHASRCSVRANSASGSTSVSGCSRAEAVMSYHDSKRCVPSSIGATICLTTGSACSFAVSVSLSTASRSRERLPLAAARTSIGLTCSMCSRRWSISRWCLPSRKTIRCVTACWSPPGFKRWRSSRMLVSASSSRLAIYSICENVSLRCGHRQTAPVVRTNWLKRLQWN